MKLRVERDKNLSKKDFTEWLAEQAEAFGQWIDLNVEAFPTNLQAQKERLRQVNDPDTGFQYFIETYLPHYVKGPASLFHKHIFETVPEIVASDKGCKEIFIAPRGSSKSTHLTLGLCLYLIVLKKAHFPCIISDIYSQAALFVEAIKAELVSNPRLRHDFPKSAGVGRMWREGEIITKNEVKVQAFGSFGKVRGRRHGPHRPDWVFMDDIENDEQVIEPKQRKKLDSWVKKAVLKMGPPDGSLKAVWAGTIIHPMAVLVKASKSPVWRTHKFQAVVKWPDNMELWEEFKELYHNNEFDDEGLAVEFYKANKAAMDLGAVVNWPQIQPLLYLMLEWAADRDSFMSEYQNKPVSEDNIFSNIWYWSKHKPHLITFGAIDPSLGKKGKGRDPSAILIGGVDPVSKQMDILHASIKKRLPDVIIADAIAAQIEYGCVLWFVEAVQFQEFLRTSLMKEAARQNVALSAIPIEQHTDKHLRIERLQPPTASGLIRLHNSQTVLIDQLQMFPDADHDDGPDCLEMLWSNGLKYAKGGAADLSGIKGEPAAGHSNLNDYRMGGFGY
jgi:predicted phage terminase large subunit-like protein